MQRLSRHSMVSRFMIMPLLVFLAIMLISWFLSDKSLRNNMAKKQEREFYRLKKFIEEVYEDQERFLRNSLWGFIISLDIKSQQDLEEVLQEFQKNTGANDVAILKDNEVIMCTTCIKEAYSHLPKELVSPEKVEEREMLFNNTVYLALSAPLKLSENSKILVLKAIDKKLLNHWNEYFGEDVHLSVLWDDRVIATTSKDRDVLRDQEHQNFIMKFEDSPNGALVLTYDLRANKKIINTTFQFMFVSYLLIFFSFLAIMFSNLKRMRQYIIHMVRIARALAQGDLTVNMPFRGNDEIGKLSDIINQMIRDMNEKFKRILKEGVNLSETMGMVLGNLNKNLGAVYAQSNQTAQISSAIDELAKTAINIAHNTTEATTLSHRTTEEAQKGMARAEEIGRRVQNVEQATESLSQMVSNLEARISEIGQITSLINDIAEQTNLLALNAAIEAARAGDQGKGFAVVADEIRKLAEKTRRATSEIEEKIKAIMKTSKETSQQMDISEEAVHHVTEGIKELLDLLSEILKTAEMSQEKITLIATTAEEQSVTTEQISSHVENLLKLANEVQERIYESIKKGTTEFQMALQNTVHIVKGFKLKDTALSGKLIAKVSIANWTARMYSLFYRDEQLSIDDISEDRCNLCEYLHKETTSRGLGEQNLSYIISLHKQQHDIARKCLATSDSTTQQEYIHRIEELKDEILKTLENAETESPVHENTSSEFTRVG